MLDDIVNALQACRSEREFWRVHIKAENGLTPLEVAALIKFRHRLPRASQLWLEGLASLGELRRRASRSAFCRQPVAPHVDLYRDPFVAPERKQLIIGFCGAANRLMMPISCVLQYLPADACDLLLLRDPAKLHYIFGIPPYAVEPRQPRAAAAPRISSARATGGRVCYGTSMGGFVALQCGLLLRGGRRHLGRRPLRLASAAAVARAGQRPCPASTRFAPATLDTATELVCYHSANQVDVADATLLARVMPVQPHRHARNERAQHHCWRCATKGRLKDFYDDVFEFSAAARVSSGGRRWPPSRRSPGAQRRPVLPVREAPIRVRRRRGRAG